MPGVPSGDRGIWEYESLHDQIHACFAENAQERLNIKIQSFSKRVGPSLKALITLEQKV